MYDLLIKNARVVTADEVIAAAVAVKEGKIAAVLDGEAPVAARQVLDLAGKYLLPGVIDCHVHFNEPGYTWREEFAQGSRAAAAGGVTTVIDMPMQNRPPVTDREIFEHKAALLRGKSAVDYGFWGALVKHNLDKLNGLQEAGALAFKCFMCNPGKDYTALDTAEIEQALVTLREFDGLAGFHCEDYDMIEQLQAGSLAAGKTGRRDYLAARPVEAEIKAVKDIVALLDKTEGRAHICHVSHPAVAEVIRRAKVRGLDITAETCVHYLLFTGEDLVKEGPRFKCSPPLRTDGDRERLWDYVLDGTLDCICSDHSPCAPGEKAEDSPAGTFGAWGGISGVQTSVQAFWDLAVTQKGADPSLVARAMSINPAAIFGLNGVKGAVMPGRDADFTVIDPQKKWKITAGELHYKHKFSAFTGLSGTGAPVLTIVRGQLVMEDGRLQDENHGQLVRLCREE